LANNYDSELDSGSGFSPPAAEISSWNTWTNRSILKGLSGLFLVFPVISYAFWMFTPFTPDYSVGMISSFIIGLVLWGVFYQMEREYRRVTPNRFR